MYTYFECESNRELIIYIFIIMCIYLYTTSLCMCAIFNFDISNIYFDNKSEVGVELKLK